MVIGVLTVAGGWDGRGGVVRFMADGRGGVVSSMAGGHV